MGFLEKLFGKKEGKKVEEEPTGIELDLKKAGTWLKDETEDFLNTTSKETEHALNEIERNLKELELSLKDLEKAKQKGHIEDRPRKLALDNRTAFIRKARAFINSTDIPDSKDTKKVMEFYKTLIASINTLVNSTRKNIYMTNMLFPQEVAEVTASSKNLSTLAEESQKDINKNKTKIDPIFKAEKYIQNTKDLITEKETENKAMDTHKKNIKKQKEKEKNIEEEIEHLNQGKEITILNQEKEKLKETEEDTEITRNKILQMFSPVTKTLKKYQRYSTGLNRDEEKTLDTYITSPLKAASQDTSFKTLDKILENTNDLIEKGRISIKDKQKQKITASLNKLKGHDALRDLLTQYTEKNKEKDTLSKKIRDTKINREIEAKKHELTAIKNTADNEEENIEKTENAIKDINKNIEANIKETETALSKISEKEVTIKNTTIKSIT